MNTAWSQVLNLRFARDSGAIAISAVDCACVASLPSDLAQLAAPKTARTETAVQKQRATSRFSHHVKANPAVRNGSNPKLLMPAGQTP